MQEIEELKQIRVDTRGATSHGTYGAARVRDEEAEEGDGRSSGEDEASEAVGGL